MENKVEKAVLYSCIGVMIMFMIATAAIPAVLAYKYCWAWLLIYPAALLAVSIFVRKRNTMPSVRFKNKHTGAFITARDKDIICLLRDSDLYEEITSKQTSIL